jgi:hypothetical protein
MTTTTADSTSADPDRTLFNVKLRSVDGSEYTGPVSAETAEAALVLAGAAARRAGMLLTGSTKVTIRRVSGDAGQPSGSRDPEVWVSIYDPGSGEYQGDLPPVREPAPDAESRHA